MLSDLLLIAFFLLIVIAPAAVALRSERDRKTLRGRPPLASSAHHLSLVYSAPRLNKLTLAADRTVLIDPRLAPDRSHVTDRPFARPTPRRSPLLVMSRIRTHSPAHASVNF